MSMLEEKTGHTMNGMDTALVIGGSRGVGEAIVLELLRRGVSRVVIADKTEPTTVDERIEFECIDLTMDSIANLSGHVGSADCVIVTAGVGRLNHFESFGASEIERTIRINATSVIELIQLFSGRLLAMRLFRMVVFTSIAGILSSPLYALYSASKAATSKYIEAVNAELAGRTKQNRILEVAPGRIDGTGFHGGVPKGPSTLIPLASDVLDAMMSGDTRYIPDFETYGPVVQRYHENPDAFGISSFNYKVNHAKLEAGSNVCVGYLSGTFDLFHIGHLNILRRAKGCCDYLVVGVHPSGAWKGKETFIPFDERKQMLAACRYVDRVITAPDEDNEAWSLVHYNKLFVGSDYEGTPRFKRYEQELGALGVEIVYFPYTNGTSSTQIREMIANTKL